MGKRETWGVSKLSLDFRASGAKCINYSNAIQQRWKRLKKAQKNEEEEEKSEKSGHGHPDMAQIIPLQTLRFFMAWKELALWI